MRARVVSQHRRFARGELTRLLAPGPSRCEPQCDVFGRCGGCFWQHVGYPDQIAAKRAILRQALERIGGCRLPAVVPFTPSPGAYRYRSRARLLVEGGRVGYRERRSHRLCAVTRCPVLALPLQAELAGLAARAAGPPLNASRSQPAEEWEIAMGSGGETRASCLELYRHPQGAGAERSRLTLRVGGDELTLSVGTFCQANALLHEALWSGVRRAVGSGDRLIELFAGAGFFTLALARGFSRLTAVEASAGAVADLQRNLSMAGHREVQVIEARVEAALRDPALRCPDVVLLDPPRVGLAPGAADALALLGARRIVYLSCDPATLARDVRRLGLQGYRLESVEGFDLFPQTPHVEALVSLRRISDE